MDRLRTLIALPLLVFASAACESQTAPTETAQSVPQVEANLVNQDIPVEALPDPLPAPYLFVDEVTEERAPITETIYVVQPGDTLATIANRFCLTVEEVQRLNNLVDINALDVGDELRIPIREGACGAANPDPADDQGVSDEPQRPPGEIYIVQEGDTLADIAFAFGFTWVELMNYNALSETQAGNLQIGQALIIPPPEETEEQEAEQSAPTEPPG